MVFYTCSGCGEALKKNKVEKHVYTCRGCEYLTCIDCGKDFYGDDYKEHNQCMTEDQKYSAKGTEFKPNKGDVKQQQWLQNIEAVISSNTNLSKKAKELIANLKNYDNIPRKQPKFLNFLKNSVRVFDVNLGEEVWDAFSAANKKETSVKSSEVAKKTESIINAKTVEPGNNPDTKNKTKLKKCEPASSERSVKLDASVGEISSVEKKKKKKRKAQDCENLSGHEKKMKTGEVEADLQALSQTVKVKKKKKKKTVIADGTNEKNQDGSQCLETLNEQASELAPDCPKMSVSDAVQKVKKKKKRDHKDPADVSKNQNDNGDQSIVIDTVPSAKNTKGEGQVVVDSEIVLNHDGAGRKEQAKDLSVNNSSGLNQKKKKRKKCKKEGESIPDPTLDHSLDSNLENKKLKSSGHDDGEFSDLTAPKRKKKKRKEAIEESSAIAGTVGGDNVTVDQGLSTNATISKVKKKKKRKTRESDISLDR